MLLAGEHAAVRPTGAGKTNVAMLTILHEIGSAPLPSTAR